MALTEDQRALLQLLLAGDTYDRVAELLGESAGEVREAHEAASALEASPGEDLSSEAVRDRLEALEGPSGDMEAERPGCS